MFGVGLGELVIILVLALVLLGPDQLPEAARKILRAVGSLKREIDLAASELKLPDETPKSDAPPSAPDPSLSEVEKRPEPSAPAAETSPPDEAPKPAEEPPEAASPKGGT